VTQELRSPINEKTSLFHDRIEILRYSIKELNRVIKYNSVNSSNADNYSSIS